jgi:hypothetical protein
VAELLARLGGAVPFAEARDLLHLVLGVRVSEAALRQRTYSAGRAALAAEAADPAGAARTPAAPARVQLSLDATKVPLVGGAWTDVKLAAFADLAPDGTATNLSYVARWEPAERFGGSITPEAQRRGVDEARLVVSPNDGAEWIQGNLDLVAHRAVRILDFPHAAEHLGVVAGLVCGEGTGEARAWAAAQRQALLDDGPAPLLAALAACQAQGPCAGARADAEGRTPAEQLAREVAYFTKRAAQLDYPTFRERGYPIGSGIAESGHKVVIAPRRKRAGQHWADHHLNPLLALRCAACNGRWDATWAVLWREQRRQAVVARRPARCGARPAARAAPVPPPATRPHPKLVVAGRPAAAHPWRKFRFGAALRPGG